MNAMDSLAAIQFMADQYPGALETRDHFGRTPLHDFCYEKAALDSAFLSVVCESSGAKNVIQFLIGRSSETLSPPTGSRITTPLHEFCTNVCKWESFCGSNCDGFEECFACQKLHRECQDLLRLLAVSDGAINAKDEVGRTPLHLLSSQGAHRDLLEVLIGAATLTDNEGRTPLHATLEGWEEPASDVSDRYEQTIEFLLMSLPQSINVQDNSGRTPLILAYERNVSTSLIFKLVSFNPLDSLGLRHPVLHR
jgi:hypothetical protein